MWYFNDFKFSRALFIYFWLFLEYPKYFEWQILAPFWLKLSLKVGMFYFIQVHKLVQGFFKPSEGVYLSIYYCGWSVKWNYINFLYSVFNIVERHLVNEFCHHPNLFLLSSHEVFSAPGCHILGCLRYILRFGGTFKWIWSNFNFRLQNVVPNNWIKYTGFNRIHYKDKTGH